LAKFSRNIQNLNRYNLFIVFANGYATCSHRFFVVVCLMCVSYGYVMSCQPATIERWCIIVNWWQ